MITPRLRRYLLFFLLLPGLLLAEWRDGEMRIRIDDVSPDDMKRIMALGIEVEHIQLPSLYLYVIPEEYSRLQQLGISPEVIIADMAAYTRRLMQSQAIAGYHDYYSANTLTDSLVSRYPTIIQKVNYGLSVEGRQLFAIKISDNVLQDEAEPEVAFDGCHHGDEIISGEILMMFIEELCQRYGKDKRVTKIVDTREIWIFPFVNPDGRQSLTRRNGNHVDLNRDWGYMWDNWGGSKLPYSQPETRAVLNWLNDHQFVFMQSIHAGTEMISYPWSYRPNACPDYAAINLLATNYANTSEYDILYYGQGFNQLYPINGSAKDSYYGLRGTLSWTMEISENKAPAANEVEKFYKRNRPAMFNLLEMAGKGTHGKIVSALDASPVAATIWFRNEESELWPVYSDPLVGDFHKILLPGQYTVKISANGFQEKILSGFIVPDSGQARLDVQLQPDLGIFGYQVIASRIPGNNYSDEGLTYRALAAPDNRYYSLGRNGWVIIDMGKTLYDLPGNDLKITEGSQSEEGFHLSVARHWQGPWQFIGSGIGSSEFDLADYNVSEFRYVRLEDDADGFSGTADAGFDLDAVEGGLLHSEEPYVIAADWRVADTLSNFNGVFEAGETVSLVMTLTNPANNAAENLSVTLSSNHPQLEVLSANFSADYIPANGSFVTDQIQLRASPEIEVLTHIPLMVDMRTENGESWRHLLTLKVHSGARLQLSADALAFSKVLVDQMQTAELNIRNGGLDTLKIFRLETGKQLFQADQAQMIIPPQQDKNFQVSFHTTEEGVFQDTLVIWSNDPAHPRQTVVMSAIAQLSPEIRLAVDSVGISLATHDQHTVNVSIANDGAGELIYAASLPESRIYDKALTAYEIPVFSYHLTQTFPEAAEDTHWLTFSEEEIRPIDFQSTSPEQVIAFPDGFPFFDQSYSTIKVHENGWLSLHHSEEDSSMIAEGSPGILPLQAKFDLQGNSRVYVVENVTTQVITWENVTQENSNSVISFQAILFPNGDIRFNYQLAEGLDSGFQTGLQPDGDYELLMPDEPLADGQSIHFQRPLSVVIANAAEFLSPGDQATIKLQINSNAAPVGEYKINLVFQSNDPEQPLLTLPLQINITEDVIAAGNENEVPESIVLHQNYPNPFNPFTTIMFELPEQSQVRMVVYNTLGQVVKTLVDEELAAGDYRVTWEGNNDIGQGLPSGIYFYELKAKDFSKIKKMVLLH